MITIRKSAERGTTRLSWLDSRHSFSFGDYYDAAHMGFGLLRVINEDRVAPGGGFAPHGHRDMEIISYVLAGALAHEDSLGTGSVIRAGDIQRMSAGTGIRHSEFNASPTEPVHFLQIWIIPERSGAQPEYEQRSLTQFEPQGGVRRIAGSGGGNALTIHAPVEVFTANPGDGELVRHPLPDGHMAWLQVARGSIEFDGVRLDAGDGAAVTREPMLKILGRRSGEALLFDMKDAGGR